MPIVTDKGEEATTAVSEHWGSVHVLTVDEEVEGEALAEVDGWPRWEGDEPSDGMTQASLPAGVHGVVFFMELEYRSFIRKKKTSSNTKPLQEQRFKRQRRERK